MTNKQVDAIDKIDTYTMDSPVFLQLTRQNVIDLMAMLQYQANLAKDYNIAASVQWRDELRSMLNAGLEEPEKVMHSYAASQVKQFAEKVKTKVKFYILDDDSLSGLGSDLLSDIDAAINELKK